MDAPDNCEMIEKLLQSTGLSCDDLLTKLQLYKSLQTTQSKQVDEETAPRPSLEENCNCNEQQSTANNDTSVILETKSSSVDFNSDVNFKNTQSQVETGDNNENSSALCPLIFNEELKMEVEACRDSKDGLNSKKSEKVDVPDVEKVTVREEDSNQIKENAESGEKEPPKSNHDFYSISDHNYSNPKSRLHLENETSTCSGKESAKPDSNNSADSVGLEQEIAATTVEDLPNSEDNLRSILRMQLSSLRNMKKSSGYLPDFKKKSMFFHNLKKKRKSCDVNPLTSLNTNDDEDDYDRDESNGVKDRDESNCVKDRDESNGVKDHDESNGVKDRDESNGIQDRDESNGVKNEAENENKNSDIKDHIANTSSLVSLTDETEFIILNVTGGIDRLTPVLEPEKTEVRRFAAVSDSNSKSEEKMETLSNDNAKSSPCDDKKKKEASPRKEIKAILSNYRRKMPFLDVSRYNLGTSRSEKKPVTLTVKKNISENFNEDPGINKSIKNNEKSPFVSDSLEDFLNESSQLKISYPIPKLGAEEGLIENTKKSPYDNVVNKMPKVESSVEQDVPPRERPKLIKAKTLAEMRRHFEKLKTTEKNAAAPYSKKMKASTETSSKNFNKLGASLSEDNYTSISPHRNNFVIYNNKKIWIVCEFKNKHMSLVDAKEKSDIAATPKAAKVTNRKPSLLSALTQNKNCAVKYKPGPLCKKIKLQNVESRDQWVTELKTLPKIYLEIVPEINKPVDPTLRHLLPVFDDPVITEERVDFALSALKPKNQTTAEPKSFKFHVAYNNKQEQMVVRRRFQPPVYKGPTTKNEVDPLADIAGVLNDIISYVEIKEIENTLIKEDDTVVKEPEKKLIEGPKGRGRNKIKRKKLDLELLRLNCKVIDVGTNETDDKQCSKPYCKMGCLCKSLLCESAFSNHCQLVECMFGCSCPPVASSDANNSLSAHTVNHLEDKAKKDLAKVEREFTQTLIHTDNDVILVGTGKIRRTSKLPKKYTDYVGDIDIILDEPKPVALEKEQTKFKNCSVVLQKLSLNNIVPYCLHHKQYSCYCKGESVYAPAIATVNHIPKIRIIKTKEDLNKSWYDSCARIRKIFPEYKVRNKDPLYNEKLRTKNIGFKTRTFDSSKEQMDEIELDEAKNHSDIKAEPVKRASKRKQSFNIREDVTKSSENVEEKEFALQRRKKKIKPNVVKTNFELPTLYHRIFDGEIRVHLQENKDMLAYIGEGNAALEYLRILPWTKLIENFHQRKISIWAREKRPLALLCNAAGYFPPKHFVDIRKVQRKSELINWILGDYLPPDRPREQMHIILTPTKNNFLISGYCLKKISTECKNVDELGSGKQCNLNLESTELPLHSFQPSITKTRSELVTPSSSSEFSSSIEEVSTSEEIIVDDRIKSQASSILKPLQFRTDDKLKQPAGPVNASQMRRNSKPMQPVILSKLLERESETTTQFQPVATSDTLSPSKTLGVKKIKLLSSPPFKSLSSIAKVKGNRKKFEFVPSLQTIASLKSKIKPMEQSTGSNGEKNVKHLQKILGVKQLFVKEPTPKLEVQARTQLNESSASAAAAELSSSESTHDTDKTEIRVKEESSNCKEETIEVQSSSSPESSEDYLPVQKQPQKVINSKKTQQDQPREAAVTVQLKKSPSLLKQSLSEPIAAHQKPKCVISSVKKFALKPYSKQIVSKLELGRGAGQQKVIPSRSLKCTHKDRHNKNKTLVLTNKEFVKRKLYYGEGTEIAAPLPKVGKHFRWRMIYLNSDFTFLSFVKPDYSIKYTDLMDVVKMSNNIKSTITLRNREFSDHYKHPMFGIFCVPEFEDRLFIGPYLPTEQHSIETLRYLQGKLIDTQIFNKMVGKKVNEKCPLWIYESLTKSKNLSNTIVIDITEDDDEVSGSVGDVDADVSDGNKDVGSDYMSNCLLCPPFVEELTQEEVKSRHINRYIVTNIPHLGYFGACQRDSKAIEVFWPNETKGYRFPNVTFAKHLLIQ
jgi:hypothetical protein